MFSFISLISNLISCRKYILREKKGQVVYPSQLDSVWFKKPKIQEVKNFKLLYVGRIRVEKGIFSLIKIFEKINKDMQLTIIGNDDRAYKKPQLKNINFKGIISDENELIKNYDNHNIS